jgi:hypothetical protein
MTEKARNADSQIPFIGYFVLNKTFCDRLWCLPSDPGCLDGSKIP